MKAFATPKATLIIADGEKPERNLLDYHRQHARLVIALDGAATWLLQQGVKPDIIIGDFDSAPLYASDGIARLHIDDQNSNDLEKAFVYCVDNNLREVMVLGAFGLRSDHFLTNLYVMRKFANRIMITFADAHHFAFLCPRNRAVTIDNHIGAFLSLYPLSEKAGPIITTGVLFPLSNESLSSSSRIGTLNRITHAHATVTCARGELLVIVQNQPDGF